MKTKPKEGNKAKQIPNNFFFKTFCQNFILISLMLKMFFDTETKPHSP